MFSLKSKGNFKNINKFLKHMDDNDQLDILEKWADSGVNALATATPKETGLTSESWGYEIQETADGYNIYWTNSNINEGFNIAVLIQYGHGTRNGGYVEGYDYINPAIEQSYLGLVEAIWSEVQDA